jgi:hypothetical protein
VPSVSTELPSVIRAAIDQFAARVVVFVTLGVWSNLRAAPQDGGTPVKTGYARACWIPSVGQSSGATGGSPNAVSQAPAQGGASEVRRFRMSDGQAFVTSACAYVQRLNDGWSAQAPSGFVDAAVAKAVNATETAFGGEQ